MGKSLSALIVGIVDRFSKGISGAYVPTYGWADASLGTRRGTGVTVTGRGGGGLDFLSEGGTGGGGLDTRGGTEELLGWVGGLPGVKGLAAFCEVLVCLPGGLGGRTLLLLGTDNLPLAFFTGWVLVLVLTGRFGGAFSFESSILTEVEVERLMGLGGRQSCSL